MRPRPCVRQLTVSLGWTGKDAVEEKATASVCASLSSYNAIPVTVSDSNTDTLRLKHTKKTTRTDMHINELTHPVGALKRTDVNVIFWEVMVMGFKILKSTLWGRGIIWCVILNTQSLGVTILSSCYLFINTTLAYISCVFYCVILCTQDGKGESHHWWTAVLSSHISSQAVERWQFDQVELKDVSAQLYLDICLLSDCVATSLVVD